MMMMLVPCRLDPVHGLHRHVLPTLIPRVLRTHQGILVHSSSICGYCCFNQVLIVANVNQPFFPKLL